MIRKDKHRSGLRLAGLVLPVFLGSQVASAPAVRKPNIVIIWGDDIGQSNISAIRMA